jgi:hypothetical protein
MHVDHFRCRLALCTPPQAKLQKRTRARDPSALAAEALIVMRIMPKRCRRAEEESLVPVKTKSL